MHFSLSTVTAILSLSLLVSAASTPSSPDCSCGYSIFAPQSQDTSDNSTIPGLYTQHLETDFLHLYSIKNNPCWTPQEYNVTAPDARGAQGKLATPLNIVPNPLPKWDSWSGEGVLGGDPGLRVWVNSSIVNGMTPIGEILSVRNDMLYGSYRINMKVTGIPGTCGAFFWYRNNSDEIDMEFLSSNLSLNSNPVALVMQTPESVAAGYNAANTSTFQMVQLPFAPDQDFHEYRFDWAPDRVTFFADGKWLQELEWSYPNASGHLSLNHWSNGNAKWSQGPPAQDAVMTVKYVKAYFNTTDSVKNEDFEKGCSTRGGFACVITDDIALTTGNLSTFFVDRGMCGERVTAKGTRNAGSFRSDDYKEAKEFYYLMLVIIAAALWFF